MFQLFFLCRDYSVHNLKLSELSKLIIFRGLVYIHKTITPIRKFWKAFLPSPYCGGFWNKFLDEQTVTIFTAEFGLLFYLPSDSHRSEVAPSRSGTVEPNAFRFKSGGMAAINWKIVQIASFNFKLFYFEIFRRLEIYHLS